MILQSKFFLKVMYLKENKMGNMKEFEEGKGEMMWL